MLEKCDIMTDIQDFIETNKSGTKRPGNVATIFKVLLPLNKSI